MFGVLSVFHTSRGATAYLFPGIDGQWSVATAQIMRGRPDLVAWSREVATAVDDWAAGSAPQLTGWFTARPSSWLLDSEARPEHALAPQALAGCVLNGLLAAQERRLDCQDSVILGHSAGMLPGWVLATSTSYRETGMFSVSEAAAALQLALLMGIHAQASPWAIGASDLRPLLEGPDDGATSPMASISGMSKRGAPPGSIIQSPRAMHGENGVRRSPAGRRGHYMTVSTVISPAPIFFSRSSTSAFTSAGTILS